MEYNMEEFLRSCVDRYRELTGVQYMRRATTPCLPEPSAPDFSDHGVTHEEVEAAEKALETAAGMRPSSGNLEPYAAKVLMKVLYAARLARFDVLKAITNLASRLTKCTRRCDKQLERLMSYINTTAASMKLEGYIGDNPKNL